MYGGEFPSFREKTTPQDLIFLDMWGNKDGGERMAAMSKTALNLFSRLKHQIENSQER